MQSRKLFQVLFMAVLCTALFVAAALAGDREDPKGDPAGKVAHQVVIHNGGPVGHWTSMKNFQHVIPSPFDKLTETCSGSCNCSVCSCSGSYSCCSSGCGACFNVACSS